MRATRLILAVGLLSTATPGVSDTSMVLPFDQNVGTYSECRDGLKHFNWVCDDLQADVDFPFFSDEGPDNWVRGSIDVQFFDLDADGLQDLILYLRQVGYCGSGGCTSRVYFGGLTPAQAHYTIQSRFHPDFAIINGKRTILHDTRFAEMPTRSEEHQIRAISVNEMKRQILE